MYRHLLVPIDQTDLSTVTISQAVEFARVLGARISFFHAQADHSTSLSGEADAVRLVSPDAYSANLEGRARELLTKAESAARAQGVPCHAITSMHDTPYVAIIAAARAEGCDLIYMASHGRRTEIGMMVGSQTLKVLMHSEIPVLVAATADPPAPVQAIATIRDEHRSLAAVLHAWRHLMASAQQQGTAPDLTLMQSMLHYIKQFPLQRHHPKEEQHLFAKLREATSAMHAELDELEHQHRRDQQLVAELDAQLASYAAGQTDSSAIEATLATYARFMWEHMGREEGVILPAAQRYLSDADWAEINAAFSQNDDPRYTGDTDAEFRQLYARIMGQAPSTH